MKLPRFLSFTLCALGALVIRATGQAPVDASTSDVDPAAFRQAEQLKAKWSVRSEVQMVAMPQERGLLLMPDLLSDDEKQVAGAVKQIQAMIQRKEATLLGWPVVTTLDGQRAVVETIDEIRYPTEFEVPTPGDDLLVDATKKKEPAPVRSSVPTAFETRNAGVTLEVEAKVLEDGKRILLNVVPQRVELAGSKSYDLGTDKNGAIVRGEQPEFFTSKVTTSVNVWNGQWMLLSFHKLTKTPETVELDLLHAVAIPTH